MAGRHLERANRHNLAVVLHRPYDISQPVNLAQVLRRDLDLLLFRLIALVVLVGTRLAAFLFLHRWLFFLALFFVLNVHQDALWVALQKLSVTVYCLFVLVVQVREVCECKIGGKCPVKLF